MHNVANNAVPVEVDESLSCVKPVILLSTPDVDR